MPPWLCHVLPQIKESDLERTRRPALGAPGAEAAPPPCRLPWHQTPARLSSSYLVLDTLVSEHENKMTFYHNILIFRSQLIHNETKRDSH